MNAKNHIKNINFLEFCACFHKGIDGNLGKIMKKNNFRILRILALNFIVTLIFEKQFMSQLIPNFQNF